MHMQQSHQRWWDTGSQQAHNTLYSCCRCIPLVRMHQYTQYMYPYVDTCMHGQLAGVSPLAGCNRHKPCCQVQIWIWWMSKDAVLLEPPPGAAITAQLLFFSLMGPSLTKGMSCTASTAISHRHFQSGSGLSQVSTAAISCLQPLLPEAVLYHSYAASSQGHIASLLHIGAGNGSCIQHLTTKVGTAVVKASFSTSNMSDSVE